MDADIVLATYNGDRYLGAQLESILAQEYQHWQLIIRDDGSSDRTREIIHMYQKRESNRLQWIDSENSRNIGVIQNFNYLLEQSRADYTFLSDQDDVWLPNKITDSLQLLKRIESQWGKATPILIHSDLSVVTEQLLPQYPSFWKSHTLNPDYNSLRQLLIRNHITGCTIVINKALRQLALPISNTAFMHDWWLGLVATTFGKIAYLDYPTVLYRQHTHNQVGARPQKWRYLFSRLQQPQKIRAYYQKTIQQAQSFAERYRSQFSAQDERLVSAYSSLEHLSFLHKRCLLIQHQFFDIGLSRNLALLSLV
jgi:glycosyltransferase involved in cell wall biosynthesis